MRFSLASEMWNEQLFEEAARNNPFFDLLKSPAHLSPLAEGEEDQTSSASINLVTYRILVRHAPLRLHVD
eukprot:m.345927 g.345927  ORF g.345927 m.345927 type:complete len:70 (-) comp55822_c0_seq3:668-877(-)